MSLAERLYFTIMIPVTLVILIIIMAYYNATEIKISTQLKLDMNTMAESRNRSVVGYEECSKDLEVTKQGVEKEKKEINEGPQKKKELEDQLKKCTEDKAAIVRTRLVV